VCSSDLAVFLVEAVVLSLIGAALGIAGGLALTRLGYELYPTVPFQVPEAVIWLSIAVALAVGVAFGIAPALRAARLDPLESLRRKA
jgi:putative ABC transport system permease protein